jgi:hypothetical protein
MIVNKSSKTDLSNNKSSKTDLSNNKSSKTDLSNNKSSKTNLKTNLTDDPPADAKDMIPPNSTWNFRTKSTGKWFNTATTNATNTINFYNNNLLDFSEDDYIVRSIIGYITYIEVINPLTIWCVIPQQTCSGFVQFNTESINQYNFNLYILLFYQQSIYTNSITIGSVNINGVGTSGTTFEININTINIKLDLFTGDKFYFQFYIEQVNSKDIDIATFDSKTFDYFYKLSFLKYKLIK